MILRLRRLFADVCTYATAMPYAAEAFITPATLSFAAAIRHFRYYYAIDGC